MQAGTGCGRALALRMKCRMKCRTKRRRRLRCRQERLSDEFRQPLFVRTAVSFGIRDSRRRKSCRAALSHQNGGGERQNGRNWGAAEKGGAVGAKAGQKRPAAGTAPSGNGTNRNGPRATEGGGPSFGRHAQGIYRSATRCRGVLSGTTGESSSSSSSSMSVTSRPVSTPSV